VRRSKPYFGIAASTTGRRPSAAPDDPPGLAADPQELPQVPPRPDMRGRAVVDGPDWDGSDGQAQGHRPGDHLDLEFEARLVAVLDGAHERPIDEPEP
jgi:hypothetical protein